MTLYLGIDPGKRGALAVYDTAEHTLSVTDMPGTTAELHDALVALPPVKLCILEQLHAGPKMASTTVAKMFEGYGVLRGALAWCDIPTVTVRPSKWKPALNLSGDKNLSRQRACEIWPGQADLFRRVKDDGRAEAALLAWYGARN